MQSLIICTYRDGIDCPWYTPIWAQIYGYCRLLQHHAGVSVEGEGAILIKYTVLSNSANARLRSGNALRNILVFVHSPGSVNNSINNSISQSTHCFRSTEARRDEIWLVIELKYQQPFPRITDSTFKCLVNSKYNAFPCTETRMIE